MCALAHFLETSGIATLVIGLVPQHVDAIAPPRALKVPFELGRPLGEPNDAAFQRQVLNQLFGLLAAPGPGSVIDEFPLDSPSQSGVQDTWSCPVSFAAATDDSVLANARAEVASLMPWFDRAGCRQASATGTSGEDVIGVLELLGAALDDGLETLTPPAGVALGDWIKLAVEDFKLFYAEAMGAQANPPGATEFGNWFWQQSEGGALVRKLRDELSSHSDKTLRTHARFTFVPSELH